MFKRNTKALGGAALCGALLVSGCANQMSQRSEHEERIERKLLDHSLQIDVGEPKVLELPQRRVRIHEQRTFEVTEFEVTRHYDRYTPYQPWRELYEIPLGAVAVVAGAGANVANIFALGNLPDSMTHDWISYGVAGLNPFMNVQSHGRAQQNLAGIDEIQRDRRLEYTSLPWSERPVQVKAGKQTHEMTTDRNGVLRLNLLDSPFAEQDLSQVRTLRISIEDAQDDVHSDSSLAISTTLRGKLLEAHTLIYDDLEDDEVSQWVHRVKRLSELGLEEEASELEQSLIELTRNDPELQQEFLKALTQDGGRLVADPGTRSHIRPTSSRLPGQLQLFIAHAQIEQAHTNPQQSHRLTPAIERLGQQLPVTLQVPPCPRLFQGGLGKIMELHFDKGFTRPITAVDTLHAPGQGLHQLREFFQATGQVR